MTAERSLRRFVVRGLVQGVGYRWFVVRAADELGLDGWVRNVQDGSVEVVAAGEPAGLEALERHLRQGPRSGRVDEVEVHPAGSPPPLGQGFSVRR